MPSPRVRWWAALLSGGFLIAGVFAQPSNQQTRREIAAGIFQQSIDAFRARDYARAQTLLRRALAAQPGNFVFHYNLACCLAAQGDNAGAADQVVKAVEHGFTDIRHLKRDPHLESVRNEAAYLEIIKHWPALQLASLEANLVVQRRMFAKGYREWRDEKLKLHCLSAFDQRTDDAVKAEFTRLSEWARANVFPDLLDPAQVADDAWVVVVLPTQADFMKWAETVYGPGAVRGTSMIAGSYEHDAKRLVSMDLGATLSHEFLHVLHWRSMTRLGQQHPVWIMEGLCSLVEDYDLTGAGTLTPTPSWRTNTVKRIAKLGKVTPMADLSTMTQTRFTGQRPLANYATARAAFLYLYVKGALEKFYADYTDTYAQDPSGLRALESATGLAGTDLDADFRGFIRALPEAAETIKPGMASLGLEVEAGAGDGPVVRVVHRRKAGEVPLLRPGDVLVSINARPVREMAELVRVLGGFHPGDTVSVEYRRGRLSGKVDVVLVAK